MEAEVPPHLQHTVFLKNVFVDYKKMCVCVCLCVYLEICTIQVSLQLAVLDFAQPFRKHSTLYPSYSLER